MLTCPWHDIKNWWWLHSCRISLFNCSTSQRTGHIVLFPFWITFKHSPAKYSNAIYNMHICPGVHQLSKKHTIFFSCTSSPKELPVHVHVQSLASPHLFCDYMSPHTIRVLLQLDAAENFTKYMYGTNFPENCARCLAVKIFSRFGTETGLYVKTVSQQRV